MNIYLLKMMQLTHCGIISLYTQCTGARKPRGHGGQLPTQLWHRVGSQRILPTDIFASFWFRTWCLLLICFPHVLNPRLATECASVRWLQCSQLYHIWLTRCPLSSIYCWWSNYCTYWPKLSRSRWSRHLVLSYKGTSQAHFMAVSFGLICSRWCCGNCDTESRRQEKTNIHRSRHNCIHHSIAVWTWC